MMSQAGEKELVGVKFKASDGIKLFRIPKKIWRKKTLFSSVSKIQARMRKLCHLFTRGNNGTPQKLTRQLHATALIILLLTNALTSTSTAHVRTVSTRICFLDVKKFCLESEKQNIRGKLNENSLSQVGFHILKRESIMGPVYEFVLPREGLLFFRYCAGSYVYHISLNN